jgi:hypothetical protein
MRTTIFVLLAALAAVLMARNPDPDEISRLDECIQRRFLGIDTFGMRRVLPMEYHGVRVFQPANPTERVVVDRLEQQHYEAAFYLAGRGVLTEAPSLLGRRAGIQGPAFITPRHGEFPQPDTLLADARRALVSFQDSEGYDVQKAAWTVALRPLRASKAACVQCHTMAGAVGLQIGDPLGVAIYVYRRASDH